jgi:hypothetical protein
VVVPKHTPYRKYFVVEVHNTTTNYTVYNAGYYHNGGIVYDTSVQAKPVSFTDLDLDRLQYAGNLFFDIEANFTPSANESTTTVLSDFSHISNGTRKAQLAGLSTFVQNVKFYFARSAQGQDKQYTHQATLDYFALEYAALSNYDQLPLNVYNEDGLGGYVHTFPIVGSQSYPGTCNPCFLYITLTDRDGIEHEQATGPSGGQGLNAGGSQGLQLSDTHVKNEVIEFVDVDPLEYFVGGNFTFSTTVEGTIC